MLRKTFLLLIASLFALSVNTQAQENETSSVDVEDATYDESLDNAFIVSDPKCRVGLGPKVGANYSLGQIHQNANFNVQNGFGYQAGLVLNAHFGRRSISSRGGTGWFGLQVEGLYSKKSVVINEAKHDFQSYEIPFMLQLYLAPRFYIEAGPTFMGYFKYSTTAKEPQEMIFTPGKIDTFDVMLSVGLGYKSRSGFMLGARYNIGHLELAGDFPITTSTVMISMGWAINMVK